MPRIAPPSAGTASYYVRFSPSFHAAGEVLATFGPEGSFVTVAFADTGIETSALSDARGLLFLDAVAELDPLGILDAEPAGIDGITLECHIQESRGTRRFLAWSPRPEREPRQHGLVVALLQLAMDVTRDPETVRRLEQVFDYLRA